MTAHRRRTISDASLLRQYWPGIDRFDRHGYPEAWQTIKHDVRAAAGHRCVRCGHPYRNGQHGKGEWSGCDERCTHGGLVRMRHGSGRWRDENLAGVSPSSMLRYDATHIAIDPSGMDKHPIGGGDLVIEAAWRILTVHHLTGDKADCRWWNLAALCQRCHLQIQGKVVMDRVWPHEHSDWFRPYVAGYYAWRKLRQNITRAEAEARVDELLALEVRQLGLGMP